MNLKIWLSIILILVLIGCTKQLINVRGLDNQQLLRAYGALLHEKPDSCLLITDSISSTAPMLSEVILLRGLSFSEKESWDSARSYFTAANRKGGGVEEEISKLFVAYLDYDLVPRPDLVSAAKYLINIKENGFIFDEAQLGLGWCFLKVQKPKEASQYFEQVIKRAKDSVFLAEAHYGLSAAFGFEKEFDQSIAQSEEVLTARIPTERFGYKLNTDSAYNIQAIRLNARILKADLSCYGKNNSNSCREFEELVRNKKPFQMDAWKSGRQRIKEDIKVFMPEIIKGCLTKYKDA